MDLTLVLQTDNKDNKGLKNINFFCVYVSRAMHMCMIGKYSTIGLHRSNSNFKVYCQLMFRKGTMMHNGHYTVDDLQQNAQVTVFKIIKNS